MLVLENERNACYFGKKVKKITQGDIELYTLEKTRERAYQDIWVQERSTKPSQRKRCHNDYEGAR